MRCEFYLRVAPINGLTLEKVLIMRTDDFGGFDDVDDARCGVEMVNSFEPFKRSFSGPASFQER